MAQKEGASTQDVVARNLALTTEVMQYLLDQPHVFDALPDNFELVLLPDDDPEMRLYNLDLLDNCGSTGKPIVFARIKSHQKAETESQPFSIFVPIASTRL